MKTWYVGFLKRIAFCSTKIEFLRVLIRLNLSRKLFFGFVHGHAYLSSQDLARLRTHVGRSEPELVREFEDRFAALVGDGHSVSFAAGRMGFYALMNSLGIKRGDEVVLHGATCSVMVNAVLRTGATPVFSDIDPETFGSSARHIEKCITPQTRMIVAQHSFGIPCEMEMIVKLARSRQVFLLEDSALALDSKIDGIAVGNFGDAALFSTDHSKPLNTLSGGLIYSRNIDLINRLLEVQAAAPDLSATKQQALWQRFCLERRYCKPSMYGRMCMIDLLAAVKSRLFKSTGPFLDEDFRAASSTSYPYPAKMPGFLAAVGIIEANRWPKVAEERKKLLRGLLDVAENNEMRQRIPRCYFDKRLDIVPLRFAWTQPDGALIREKFAGFVHVAWTWFLQPIIATSEPLEHFGYHKGVCPISERVGSGMVNLPCNLSQDDASKLIKLFHANVSSGMVVSQSKKIQPLDI